jgi:hypothetical protein
VFARTFKNIGKRMHLTSDKKPQKNTEQPGKLFLPPFFSFLRQSLQYTLFLYKIMA